MITALYKGTLVDGTEFAISINRGMPAKFPVNRVIAGRTEALKLMPVGSKWELLIPSDLAYGPEGTPSIPPHSTLVFEVELISIDNAKEYEEISAGPLRECKGGPFVFWGHSIAPRARPLG